MVARGGAARAGRSAGGRVPLSRPRGSRPERAVVVHPDPSVRADWARALEAAGMTVLRCVGPTVSCALDESRTCCPLLDEVDLAVYHEALLGPEREAAIRASGSTALIIAARDHFRLDGSHEPLFVRSAPGT